MTQNVPRGTMTIGNALRTALGIFSGKMIFICETGRSADLPVSLFSRIGANPLSHALQRASSPEGGALFVLTGRYKPQARKAETPSGLAFRNFFYSTPERKISRPMPMRMTPPRMDALPESSVPNFLPMFRPAMQRKKVTTAMMMPPAPSASRTPRW